MKKHWLRNALALLAIAALLLSSFAALAEEVSNEVGEVDLMDPGIYVAEVPEVEVTIGDNAQGEDAAQNAGVLFVSPKSVKLAAGDTVSVVVTFTEPEGQVRWASSNEKVATCQWGNGWSGDDIYLYINGLKKGSATITVSNSVTKDKVKIKVKVTKASTGGSYTGSGKKDGKATYRALLIGEEAFNPICTRNRGDVALMNKMLKSVKGAKGGRWTITQKFDINNPGVKSAIKSSFKKADEDDVSLFFIATHGDADNYGEYAGALAMIPEGSYAENFLLMSELAAALKEVPGKVIVIIEACGSGAGVFSTYAEQNNVANAAARNAAKAFDQAAIDAFASVDPGIVESNSSRSVAKTTGVANTGELRVKNKFYVLTASRYQELSWGTEQGPFNYFTKWLTDGIGTSGKMKADTNGDKKATLKEVFNYISKVGDNYSFYDGTGYYYQHVQYYPKGSTFVLFKR